MSEAFKCIFGPRLYRIYGSGRQNQVYEPGVTEAFGDKVIYVASCVYSMSVVASPVIGYFIIKRGLLSFPGIISLAHFGMTCLFILAGSYCIRGYGRLTNREYRKFLKVLNEVKKPDHQYSARKQLATYDFQFSSWPVDFHWNESSGDKKKLLNFQYSKKGGSTNSNSILGKLTSLPLRVARYIVAHWFARPLMYPGSVKLLNAMMAEALTDGRSSLVAKDGWRAKLQTQDNNEIDTMFIDRRSSSDKNGQTLVIGCEGNAAFYEVGTILTPLKADYSVLGWNHPGFAGSTGLPYPEAERNAIDVVIKYAIDRLGFSVEDIVIYAWSIGAYSASWAAMMYPDIKGLVLDATFDTIAPLAIERMPGSMSKFTEDIVNDYFPLFIHEHLVKYSGPILLYRRTRDEMIATVQGELSTNRGNFLLIELLKSRYPNLITVSSLESVNAFLSAEDNASKAAVTISLGVDEERCERLLEEYKEEEGNAFPCLIGDSMKNSVKSKLLVYLAIRHMIDFDSTHCVPLPPSVFQVPEPI